MNKLFGVFVIIFLWLGVSSFADVNSTREILSDYSSANSKVLERYDRLVKSWSEYAEYHKEHWDLETLLKAVEYAAVKHQGQVRKDAEQTPYIIHPLGVTELVWNIGDIRSVNVLTAALLHDTLEDTDATIEEIENLFGPRVVYTVQELTNDPALSSKENKQRQIDHAPTMSLDGQLVKLADRLYNVTDLRSAPPSWSKEKIKAYYNWGEKLLNALTGTNASLEFALRKEIDNHKVCNYKSDFIGFTHLLTSQDIINAYHHGVEIGATHMLIVWETFDYFDHYNFVVYSYPNQNVNDLVSYYDAPGFYRMSAVYAMHLDIIEQLKECHPWHIEYPNQ